MTISFNIVTPDCRLVHAWSLGSTTYSVFLTIILDNIEKWLQQNIVQCCFHQARTGCSFLVVYTVLDSCGHNIEFVTLRACTVYTTFTIKFCNVTVVQVVTLDIVSMWSGTV